MPRAQGLFEAPLRRRDVLAGAASLLGLSALAACGGQSGSQGQNAVTFVAADPKAVWQPFLSALAGAHQTVDAHFQYVPFADIENTLIQRLASHDSTIDVFYLDPPEIPTFVQRGFLADLTPNFGSDVKAKTLPAAAQAATYQGKLRSMPVWTSTQVLFYNRDLLQKAGVEPPSASPQDRMTWEQIAANGKRAQQAGAKWGFAFGQPIQYYQLQPLPESLGGGPGVHSDCGLSVDLTNESWIKAASWYRDVYAQGIAPRGIDIGQTGQAFLNGQVAYYVDVPAGITNFAKAKQLHWGIAAFPYFAGGKPVTPTDSWHFGLSPSSAHTDAARRFLSFAGLDPTGNLATVATAKLPPTNKAAFASYGAGVEKIGPEVQGFAALVDHELANTAVHRPFTLGYTALESKVTQAWSDIRAGGDPRQVLTRTQQDLQQQFSRIKCS